MPARLFVAVPLPADMRASLADFGRRQALERVRWLPPENLHVTVHFLGRVERDAIDPLTSALAAASAPVEPFTLRIEDARPGPPRGQARMVWATLEPSEPFAGLAESLARAAAPFAPGAAPPRPGRPHVTLARLRPRPARAIALEPLPLAGAGLAVSACELFESSLSPAGARYTSLAALPLAAA